MKLSEITESLKDSVPAEKLEALAEKVFAQLNLDVERAKGNLRETYDKKFENLFNEKKVLEEKALKAEKLESELNKERSDKIHLIKKSYINSKYAGKFNSEDPKVVDLWIKAAKDEENEKVNSEAAIDLVAKYFTKGDVSIPNLNGVNLNTLNKQQKGGSEDSLKSQWEEYAKANGLY